MNIDISKLPERIKLEVSKSDLQEFAEFLISQKTESESTEKEPEIQIMDIDQAVELLGLAKQTIYNKASRREIPHFKKGRKLYFKRSELMEWIESGKQSTREELSKIANTYFKRRAKRI